MRNLRLSLLLTAAAAGGLVAISAFSAEASPLCYKVATTGTQIPNRTVGPYCVTPYPYGVECSVTTTGIDPSALVHLSYCTP